jgi:hypothetical protein
LKIIGENKNNYIKSKKTFVKIKDSKAGITLIAMVITIIVLLILARNFNSNAKWR